MNKSTHFPHRIGQNLNTLHHLQSLQRSYELLKLYWKTQDDISKGMDLLFTKSKNYGRKAEE